MSATHNQVQPRPSDSTDTLALLRSSVRLGAGRSAREDARRSARMPRSPIMKIVHIETLLSAGRFAKSKDWAAIQHQVKEAVSKVDWPPGSGKFTIYPESGKKRDQGNGVTPIK